MKIRVFCNMINSVYKVTFLTEDWSCSDIELMVQYGEPDVNLGGDVTYTYDGEQKEKAFGDRYERKTLLKWLKVFFKRFFSQQFKRSCIPDGPKVGSVSLSPRGDWRMPSDATSELWLSQLEAL